ncbi:MAG: histidinol-phosphatase HisJ family protein [Clostridia bacterium]|nr:histidinol-phosphatase HisJ family protein [Clostridia bacterium]
MGYKNLVDFHVHTDNSCDGHDSLMVISEHAAAKGIRAIAVTDHAECHRYFEDNFHLAIRYSYFETLKAKSAFRGQVAIMTGIELGQPLHDLQAAEDALSANVYDFVVAGLHLVRGETDFWKIDYSNADAPRLLHTYFDELYETACWGKFDAMSHLTYPLRYIVGRENISVNLSDYFPQIDRILSKLVADGKALELNTQGYRTPYGHPTPTFEILKRFKELGWEYVTIGSDAHHAADVGANVEDGFLLLKRAGFDYVTIYDRREPILLPII